MNANKLNKLRTQGRKTPKANTISRRSAPSSAGFSASPAHFPSSAGFSASPAHFPSSAGFSASPAHALGFGEAGATFPATPLFALCATLILLISGCAKKQRIQPQQTIDKTWLTMGTFASLTLRTDTPEIMPNYFKQTKNCFENVNQKLSTYLPDSEITRINSSTGTIEISEMTADMLKTSLYYSKISEGAFDPTMKPLIHMWGFNGATPPTNVPSPETISTTLRHTGYKNIELRADPNSTNHSSFIVHCSSFSLDLGGIAKGYAVDRAYDRLTGAVLQNGFPHNQGRHYQQTKNQTLHHTLPNTGSVSYNHPNTGVPHKTCKTGVPHKTCRTGFPNKTCRTGFPVSREPVAASTQNPETRDQNPETRDQRSETKRTSNIEHSTSNIESRNQEPGTSFLINLGGNIRCHGTATPQRPWCIGVRNPFDSNDIIGSLSMQSGMAVATSGNYERFVTINGKRYAHIIDPRTGYPVQGMAGVTILSNSATKADAMSTAIYVAGIKNAPKILKKLQTTYAIIIPDKKPIEIWISPELRDLFKPMSDYVNNIHLLK